MNRAERNRRVLPWESVRLQPQPGVSSGYSTQPAGDS
jgi:hypothetical protein